MLITKSHNSIMTNTFLGLPISPFLSFDRIKPLLYKSISLLYKKNTRPIVMPVYRNFPYTSGSSIGLFSF